MATAKNAKKEPVKLERGKNYFTIIGEVKLSDKTFPEESESAGGFISRRLNLGIKTAEGLVQYVEAFGGFHGSAPRDIKIFQKPEKGEKKGKELVIPWENRFDLEPKTLSTINDFSMFVVALEKLAGKEDQNFRNRFFSAYDAIAYMQEHLEDGMRIMVSGKHKPNLYEGKVTFKKEITSIQLYTGKEANGAFGTLTVLIDENSINAKRMKTDDEIDIYASIIDYSSKHKANIPFAVELVLPLHSKSEDEQAKAMSKYIISKIKCAKNEVKEVTFKILLQDGNVVQEASIDDLDAETRELIELKVLSVDDVLGKMAVKGNKTKRFIISEIDMVRTGDEESGITGVHPAIDATKYTLADIVVPELDEEDDKKKDVEAEVSADEVADLIKKDLATSGSDDDFWKNVLG